MLLFLPARKHDPLVIHVKQNPFFAVHNVNVWKRFFHNDLTVFPFISIIYTPIKAIRQSSAVMIENTATTRVSDHPHSSKW